MTRGFAPNVRWAGALVAGSAVAMIVRRLGRRSGATDEEVGGHLPGDEFVGDPMWQSTRAITISAHPREVWPWIVQMGFPAYRAGWYTPHWLDRLQWGIRERSADHIVEELQTLTVGDRVPDSRDWSVFFTVEAVEPERFLILRSTRHILRPMRSIDFTWAFVLEPSGPCSTRFVIRARARYAPRWSWLILGAPFSLGDFLNTSNILREVKRRCEARTAADGTLVRNDSERAAASGG